MKNKIIPLLIGIVLFSSLVGAASFTLKQYGPIDLKIPVVHNNYSKTTSATTCYLTMKKPSEELLINDQLMAYHSEGYYSFTLNATTLTSLGVHKASMRCDNGADFGFSTFDIEVTSTGQSGGLSSYLILFVLGFGLILFVIALFTAEYSISFIAGILFLMSGIYLMIYGLGSLNDLYTRAFGYVTIGMGIIITIASAYNYVEENMD